MGIRRRVVRILTRIFFRRYLSGFVACLPELDKNVEARRELIDSARSLVENRAYAYIRDSILDYAMRETAFRAKDEIEIAWNRGVAHGIQLFERRVQELKQLTHGTDEKRQTDDGASRR